MKHENLPPGIFPTAGAKPEDLSTPSATTISQAALNELVQTLQGEKFRLETLVCYLLQLNEQLRNEQSHSTNRPTVSAEASETTER